MAFLCLLCRQAGHKTADCPESSKPIGAVTPARNAVEFPGLHGTDITSGHVASSPLCPRCDDLKLLDLLLREDVRDEFGSLDDLQYNKQLWKERQLGPYRSIELRDSCPLCRLIFGVFPAEDTDVGPASSYYLKPMRTYNLSGGSIMDAESTLRRQRDHVYTESELLALHESYSVTVYVVPSDINARMAVLMGVHRELDDKYQISFGIAGPPVASAMPQGLLNPNPNTRTGLAPRPRGKLIDFGTVTGWLAACDAEHNDCHSIWRDELLTSTMLDVTTNELVPCPPHCKYTALSYVWGRIVPAADALRKGTLPPTIADAIEATRKIGLHYLWVDALCIDQTPSPRKMQQINMMDAIYEGANVTLLALHGDSSLYGLPGVSDPQTSRAMAAYADALPVSAARMGRPMQPYELVDGYPLAAAYRVAHADFMLPGCSYMTRAWTMQEQFLSRRALIFGRDQVHMYCRAGSREETTDAACDPAQMLRAPNEVADTELFSLVHLEYCLSYADSDNDSKDTGKFGRGHDAITHLLKVIGNYTGRRMANPQDSLNAIAGLLSYMRRAFRLQPFVWGLPLHDFPQFLLWHHNCRRQDADVADGASMTPVRRRDFPSWSYTGWQGKIAFVWDDGPKNKEPHLVRQELAERGLACDLAPAVVSIGHVGQAASTEEADGADGKVLTLRGWTVRFEIKSDPFNEAFVPGTDVNMGRLLENNHMHPLTLPDSVFDFVVLYRVKKAVRGKADVARHTLYLMMLDDSEAAQNGGIPSRRTLVRWTVDMAFVETAQYAAMLQYSDGIQVV